MSWYKIRIDLRSSLATPLIGDTIFGHVCWGLVRKKGEEALSRFIANCDQDPSYFAVSNAFPADMLPIPILPVSRESMAKNTMQYGKKKKHKKRHFIPAKEVLSQTEPLTSERLNQILEQSEETFKLETEEHLHNTINRLTGTTEGPTGLYSTVEYVTKPSNRVKQAREELLLSQLDLYVVSNEPLHEVKSFLTDAFMFGYGADSSIGKGWIEIKTIEEINIPKVGNCFLALGPFIPTDEERKRISNFRYELFMRRGKLGPEFVHLMNPFKKPILFYREGSTFSLSIPKSVVGTLLTGVHTERFIRHAAHTPILPITVEV